jgi:hypothetical protein
LIIDPTLKMRIRSNIRNPGRLIGPEDDLSGADQPAPSTFAKGSGGQKASADRRTVFPLLKPRMP